MKRIKCEQCRYRLPEIAMIELKVPHESTFGDTVPVYLCQECKGSLEEVALNFSKLYERRCYSTEYNFNIGKDKLDRFGKYPYREFEKIILVDEGYKNPRFVMITSGWNSTSEPEDIFDPIKNKYHYVCTRKQGVPRGIDGFDGYRIFLRVKKRFHSTKPQESQ